VSKIQGTRQLTWRKTTNEIKRLLGWGKWKKKELDGEKARKGGE
jgi:hypothetical protein